MWLPDQVIPSSIPRPALQIYPIELKMYMYIWNITKYKNEIKKYARRLS